MQPEKEQSGATVEQKAKIKWEGLDPWCYK